MPMAAPPDRVESESAGRRPPRNSVEAGVRLWWQVADVPFNRAWYPELIALIGVGPPPSYAAVTENVTRIRLQDEAIGTAPTQPSPRPGMLACRPAADTVAAVAIKPGDAVIASRYVGPPLEDATVVALGEERPQGLGGETDAIKTATVRFADGQTATVAADGLLPGGPNYVVRTPDGETWCESAAEIAEAIGNYVKAGAADANLSKVSVVLMPPDQRTGVGQELSAGDFYVAI